MCNRQTGFTLVELMIVVVVIGILSYVAVPSYISYLQTGNAQEAPSSLLAMKTQAEQHFASNPGTGYANYPCTAPATAAKFTYTCPVKDANNLTIQAAGNAATNISGWTYTINQDGTRGSSNIGSASSSTCWITKANGSC